MRASGPIPAYHSHRTWQPHPQVFVSTPTPSLTPTNTTRIHIPITANLSTCNITAYGPTTAITHLNFTSTSNPNKYINILSAILASLCDVTHTLHGLRDHHQTQHTQYIFQQLVWSILVPKPPPHIHAKIASICLNFTSAINPNKYNTYFYTHLANA